MEFSEEENKDRIDLQWSDHSYFNIGLKSETFQDTLNSTEEDICKSDHCYHTCYGSETRNQSNHTNHPSKNIDNTCKENKTSEIILKRSLSDSGSSQCTLSRSNVSDHNYDFENTDKMLALNSCDKLLTVTCVTQEYERQSVHKDTLTDLSNSPVLNSPSKSCTTSFSPGTIKKESSLNNNDNVTTQHSVEKHSSLFIDDLNGEIIFTAEQEKKILASHSQASYLNKKRNDHSYCFDMGSNSKHLVKKARTNEGSIINQLVKFDHSYIKRTRSYSCEIPGGIFEKPNTSEQQAKSASGSSTHLDIANDFMNIPSIPSMPLAAIRSNDKNIHEIASAEISIPYSSSCGDIALNTESPETFKHSLFACESGATFNFSFNDLGGNVAIPLHQSMTNLNLKKLPSEGISVTPFKMPVKIINPFLQSETVTDVLPGTTVRSQSVAVSGHLQSLMTDNLSQDCFQSAPCLHQSDPLPQNVKLDIKPIPLSNRLSQQASTFSLPATGDLLTTTTVLGVPLTHIVVEQKGNNPKTANDNVIEVPSTSNLELCESVTKDDNLLGVNCTKSNIFVASNNLLHATDFKLCKDSGNTVSIHDPNSKQNNISTVADASIITHDVEKDHCPDDSRNKSVQCDLIFEMIVDHDNDNCGYGYRNMPRKNIELVRSMDENCGTSTAIDNQYNDDMSMDTAENYLSHVTPSPKIISVCKSQENSNKCDRETKEFGTNRAIEQTKSSANDINKKANKKVKECACSFGRTRSSRTADNKVSKVGSKANVSSRTVSCKKIVKAALSKASDNIDKTAILELSKMSDNIDKPATVELNKTSDKHDIDKTSTIEIFAEQEEAVDMTVDVTKLNKARVNFDNTATVELNKASDAIAETTVIEIVPEQEEAVDMRIDSKRVNINKSHSCSTDYQGEDVITSLDQIGIQSSEEESILSLNLQDMVVNECEVETMVSNKPELLNSNDLLDEITEPNRNPVNSFTFSTERTDPNRNAVQAVNNDHTYERHKFSDEQVSVQRDHTYFSGGGKVRRKYTNSSSNSNRVLPIELKQY